MRAYLFGLAFLTCYWSICGIWKLLKLSILSSIGLIDEVLGRLEDTKKQNWNTMWSYSTMIINWLGINIQKQDQKSNVKNNIKQLLWTEQWHINWFSYPNSRDAIASNGNLTWQINRSKNHHTSDVDRYDQVCPVIELY